MRIFAHIVTYSPWPFLISLNLTNTLYSLIGSFTGILLSYSLLIINLLMLILILYLWLIDINIESLTGYHTNYHSNTILLAFLLFCLTEIILFITFFWGYFHNAWNSNFLIWPPSNILPVNPYSIPLLNTLLLFWAGISLTVSHHFYINLDKPNLQKYLNITIILTVLFFILQLIEFSESTVDITDSAYGCGFFMLTGLHGFHIFVAIITLLIVLMRLIYNHRITLYFNCVIIYFHILDIIWIALVILIYM